MKSKHPHRIPLSVAAQAVLENLPKRGDLVFPSRTGKGCMSDETLRSLVKAHKVTVHGMRSSLRTWCQEHEVARDVAEKMLSHTVAQNSAEAAYAHSDLFEARRAAGSKWAAHVTG